MLKPYDTLQSEGSYLQNANNYSEFFLVDFDLNIPKLN